MDNHTIYAASVRQLNGVIAERDALTVALAAKSEQVAGLIAERAELREQLAVARGTVVISVSSVRDDALDDDDDDEPDHFEDVGGGQ